MNLAIDSALAGMRYASEQIDSTARRLSRISSAEPADTVELSREMIDMIKARHAFSANAAVLTTSAEIQRGVIDLLA